MNSDNEITKHAAVPMENVGPIRIVFPDGASEELMVPLATYESPLWPSVGRGAKVSVACGGIRLSIMDDRMARSIVVEASDGRTVVDIAAAVRNRMDDMQAVVAQTSRFAKLVDVHCQVVGRLLFLRFSFSTGDASGHNMSTLASDRLMEWLLKEYPKARYVSVSGNYCSDKKVSAVNGILGRGKYAVADISIPSADCVRLLRAPAERIAALNVKKNLIGSVIAGGVRSANAHYANILLAFYLATGQDAANIVEGSQGITTAESGDSGLYFSVTLPNLIMGTVGNGKDIPFVQENLRMLGCTDAREPGENARRLACICAAAVLCGELSLLAAQTNPGELMKAHQLLERRRHGSSRQRA